MKAQEMKVATRVVLCLIAGATALAAHASAATADASAVRAHCSGCHRESAPGHFDRISDMHHS